jgi:hypothetical protein
LDAIANPVPVVVTPPVIPPVTPPVTPPVVSPVEPPVVPPVEPPVVPPVVPPVTPPVVPPVVKPVVPVTPKKPTSTSPSALGVGSLAGAAIYGSSGASPLPGFAADFQTTFAPTQFESVLENFSKFQQSNNPNAIQNALGNDMNSYTYGLDRPIQDILSPGENALPYDDYQYSQENVPQYMRTGVKAAAAGGAIGGTRYGRYARGGLSVPLMAHGGKMRVDFRHGDAVTGAGDGQSDDIPAMLADGEFVFPADVVAAIGNGSTKAGSDKLYDMMHGIRAHARSAKPRDLPPEIKSPLDFLKNTKRTKARS